MSLQRTLAALILSTAALSACGGSSGSSDGRAFGKALTGAGHIAYVSNGGLNIFDLQSGSGKLYKVSDDIQDGVTASRTGLLSFLTEPSVSDVAQLNTVRADGTRVAAFIHRFSGFALSGAHISPDGKMVAYGIQNRIPSGVFGQVYYAQLDGSGARFVNADQIGFDVGLAVAHPAWMPDGRLLFTTRTGFQISDATLTRFSPVPSPPLANPGHPSVSPDGRYIVFDQERGANVGDGKSTYRAIWALDLESHLVFQLTKGVIEQTHATFSPDGSSILFNDSSPFAIPTIGAFRRSYLSSVSFSHGFQDVSKTDATVKGPNGKPVDLFGFAAAF